MTAAGVNHQWQGSEVSKQIWLEDWLGGQVSLVTFKDTCIQYISCNYVTLNQQNS